MRVRAPSKGESRLEKKGKDPMAASRVFGENGHVYLAAINQWVSANS